VSNLKLASAAAALAVALLRCREPHVILISRVARPGIATRGMYRRKLAQDSARLGSSSTAPGERRQRICICAPG